MLFCTQLLAQSPPPSRQLLQQGVQLYEAQRYSDAIAVWERALRNYQTTDALLEEALSLRYLSLGHQQQGNWESATATINRSLQILENLPTSPRKTEILAKALNTQGQLQYREGRASKAYETWETAAQFYAQIGEKNGQLIAQLNQTQALQAQGLSQKAKQHLQRLRETFPEDATTLRYLGKALRQVGELSKALETLEESLSYEETPETWLAIANTEFQLAKQRWRQQQYNQAQDDFKQAEQHYQKANSLRASQLNQLRLYIETGKWEKAKTLFPDIQETLSQLPSSRTTISDYYNLAESLICLRPDYQPKAANCSQFWLTTPSAITDPPTWTAIAQITRTGLTQARQLGDTKKQAEGLGLLGNLYEHTQQWQDAKKLTQQAYRILKPITASKLVYRWEWQLGRLETQLGNWQQAKAAYQSALLSLDQVREDLITVETNVDFSFQENIEPLYREYVGLLLRGKPTEKDLESAIATTNNLQLAELENYLRCSLRSLLNLTQNLEAIDPNAVYLYPILLPNELALIVQLPQQPLKLYRHSVSEETVITALQQLQTGILRRRSDLTRESGHQFYQWLISPLEKDLAEYPNLETLVFTLDPKLRNLPLAVLYDQQQEEYLVEKPFALALTPNSQLFSLEETAKQPVNILAGGISESLQVGERKFSPLKAQEELSQLQNLANSLILLNQEFTRNRLATNFNRQPFSVIHLATHGQFSSNPEATYILAYDETGNGTLFNSTQFSGFLKELQLQQSNDSLDLLVLSACETATGDDRALLGLAGIAITAGAKSTLATQWKVSDDSTVTLIKEFYQQLRQPNVSKAQALHRAQQALRNNLNTQNPFFWGAYVLVGNWL